MRTNFLNEDYRPEDPLRKVVSARQQRRIARILNDFQGVNCRVEKPSDAEGRGWRIVVDGTTDIEDPRGGFFPIPDTSGYNTAINPDGRQTLEKNAETVGSDTASHLNEWQLRNVNFVKEGSSSIPFFVSATPLQGSVPDKVSGELYWAQVDSKRYNGGNPSPYKSLDITNDFSDTTKGKWNLGLYGFVGSASCSAPYSIHNGANRELTWQVPVTIAGNPYAGVTSGYVTMYHQLSAGTAYGTSTAALNIKLRSAAVNNGTLNFETQDTLTSLSIPVNLTSQDVNSIGKHDSFSDTQNSSKHDARFLHRTWSVAGVPEEDDKYSVYNQCESIAYNTSGKHAIEFNNGQLLDATAGVSVSYGGTTRLLQGTWNMCFNGSGAGVGGAVGVGNASSPFVVKTTTDIGGDNYPAIKAYSDSGPITEVRGLRLYARDSTSVYFDLEITDGVLTFRDHTGANCGEIRRSL